MAPRTLRIPLLGGLFKLAVARGVVGRSALRAGSGGLVAPGPDAVTAGMVPSVSFRGTGDRVLAEVDQDGFLFAADPCDAPFFDRRAGKIPRRRSRLEVVLRGGAVVLRKQHLRPRGRIGMRDRFWGALGLGFYTEAAALLRLQGLPCVPRLREIDTASRALFMDFLGGENLRHRVAAWGGPVFDLDLASEPFLGRLSPPDRVRRELRLWSLAREPFLREALRGSVEAMHRRGVAPLDVHLANVVVGGVTGQPYWVDFELARLRAGPGWADLARENFVRVDEALGLSRAGETGTGRDATGAGRAA